MMHSAPQPDAGLPEFLAARARHASDTRLAVNAGAGLVAASAALWWRPPAWPLFLSAAACFFCYGVWGIADRELQAPGRRAAPALAAVLRGTRALAAAAGALALLVLLFGIVALGLGTWIS